MIIFYENVSVALRKAVDNKAFGELLTDLLKASDSLSYEDLIEELHDVRFMMFHWTANRELNFNQNIVHCLIV